MNVFPAASVLYGELSNVRLFQSDASLARVNTPAVQLVNGFEAELSQTLEVPDRQEAVAFKNEL